MTMKWQNTIRLADAGVDFDDVFRGLANKRSDIELDGELWLVIHPKKHEAPDTKSV